MRRMELWPSFSGHVDDENIPNNQAHDAEDVTQTGEQANIGPITRSRAKKLQQQVTSFLAETNFNINENFILPKYATLVVLRYTHKEEKQDRTNKNRPPDRTTKRNSHNFWFPKAMKVIDQFSEDRSEGQQYS
jgi:hypothetical protein